MARTGDVEFVDKLADDFEEEAEEEVRSGPRKPSWYVPVKTPPKAEDIEHKAQMEREEHAYRLARIGEINSILNTERAGSFVRDRRAINLGEIEQFYGSSIRDEFDLLCSYLGQMNWAWKAPYMDITERDEAMAKQSFVKLVVDDWIRTHSAQGNGPLRIAIPDTFARYGMAAVFIAPDSTNEATGIDLRMLDPATVFPIFEGKRGMTQCFVIYNASPERVIADFDSPAHKVRSKVNKIVAQQNPETSEGMDPYWEAEVVEWWSMEWVVILYNGVKIAQWRHGYYKVPFVVKYGCFGMQGFTSTPMYDIDNSGSGSRVTELEGWDDRRIDLARKAQPFLWRRVVLQYQEEKFGSRLMTMFRRAMNPPMVLRASPMTQRFLNPKIDTREGGLSRIGQDDELEPLDHLPDNGVIQGLQSLFDANRMTSIARGMMTPISPGTQSSGTALEIMTDAGYERWAPMSMVIEEFLSEIGERCNEIWLEHGEMLGPKKSRGRLAVPLSDPDPVTKSGKIVELTSEMLEQVGTRITCTLFRISLGSLPQTANALSLLMDRGLVHDRLAMELLRISDDPERDLDVVKAKKMDMIPIIEQYDIMDMYAKAASAAIERGDEEGAAKMLFRMERLMEAMQTEWAMEQVKKVQAELAMMDPMGMMMGGMGAEGEGGAPPESELGGSGALPIGPGGPAMGGGSPAGSGPGAGLAAGVEIPGGAVSMGVPPGQEGGRKPQG